MNNSFKTYSLIIFLFAIVSCSSDDNTSDIIVGNWEYETQFENDIENKVHDCKPSTISFSNSGNRNDKYYDENFNDECVIVDDVNLTWEKVSANTYKFSQDNSDYVQIVVFQNSNNQMVLESSNTDGDGNINTIKFIYNRID